ncbi:MAG TPA: pyruvate ferredoxin oxidoreductase [Candidatus Nanoarchaeia archaeon]|nr:pyruvate ferredoxin oxidoreductase [Candidatus Nanoarchaeia archaeon]
MPENKNKPQILEGSRAIALTIKNIKPSVVSAYPITPQTHIVEDLARFKADGPSRQGSACLAADSSRRAEAGEADYEYVRAESEFAAASIILGASATGVRVYSSTSSQGLLLMTEVIFNIAGMRLPVVITCANRAVSAPINIWNDAQDVMTIRDAGWIHFFAENHQEAVTQHILAYKIAEKLNIPVMVNVDGFILTHSYEEVVIPSEKDIKKFLPDYQPKPGTYLDPAQPRTFGAFATPADYMEIRQQLHDDLISSLDVIKSEYEKYNKIINIPNTKYQILNTNLDNGLLEYYGPVRAKTVIIAMGSVVGTIKEVIDEKKSAGGLFGNGGVGVLKLKTFRPFPTEEIIKVLKTVGAKNIAVVEKAISLGNAGPLYLEIKAALQEKISAQVKNFIVGLGGRDVTREMIRTIITKTTREGKEVEFVGK